MSGNKDIDYTKALQALLKYDHPRLKMDSKSRNFLSAVMNEINRVLLTQFDEERASGADANKSLLFFAQKAVEKKYKGGLKKHAISEAQRQLALFETGCMKYDSEMEIQQIKLAIKAAKSVERSKKSRPIVNPQSTFKSGIGKMCVSSQPDFSMENVAKDYLASHLCNFTWMVGKKIAEMAGEEDELQPVDVKRTVAEFLGPEVMRIANSEGNRSLVLYENGLITFRPKEPSMFKVNKEKKEDDDNFSGKIFRAGIKGFLPEFNEPTAIDSKSSKMIEDILMAVGNHLAFESAAVCRGAEKEEMNHADVHNVVQNSFPELLRHHALVQGANDVDSYKNGSIKYNWQQTLPRKKPSKMNRGIIRGKGSKTVLRKSGHRSTPAQQRKRKVDGKTAKIVRKGKKKAPTVKAVEKKMKAKKPTRLDFTSALLDLSPNLFPNREIALQRDTSNQIGNILDDVCQQLATEAAIKANNETELGIDAINRAVAAVFPPGLAEHAIAFGARTVALNSSSDEP